MNIQKFRDAVASKIHGTTLAKIGNFYGTLKEAAGNVVSRIDPKETIKIAPFASHLYDQVYDYTAPSDLKDDKIIDIRPMVNRKSSDSLGQLYSQQFDINKGNRISLDNFAIRDNNGVKTIRIDKALTPPLAIHTMDSLTQDGTWSAGGDVSNLELDGNFYQSGIGSFKFDLSGSAGSGYLENSTMTAKDLSDLENIGGAFMWAYLSSLALAGVITNLKLRLGSSSSNYIEMTATTPQDQATFKQYWNLVRWNFNGATTTGTPDLTLVTYARITFTYTSGTAYTGLYVDNIVAQLGTPFEIEYYSQYLFKNSAGTWIEYPTALTDTIVLGITSENILLYEFLKLLGQELQGKDGAYDYSFYTNELEGIPPKRNGSGGKKGLYDQYGERFPSQAINPQTEYYHFSDDFE